MFICYVLSQVALNEGGLKDHHGLSQPLLIGTARVEDSAAIVS